MIQSAGNVGVSRLEMLPKDLVNQAGTRPALVLSRTIKQLPGVFPQANKEGFVLRGHVVLSDSTVSASECTKTIQANASR
jgi:hypothetical protein